MPALTPTGSGYHYPLGTDPLTNGSAAIQALAEDLDRKAGLGQAGSASLTCANAESATKTVTFIAGRFTGAPKVQASANNSLFIGNAINVTVSSFTLTMLHCDGSPNNTTSNVFWIARQG